MSDWRETPLSRLASFQKGRKVDTSPFPQEGFQRYLGASGLAGGDDGYANENLAVIAKCSDTLMLWDGERSGFVGYGQEGVVASTVSKLSPVESVHPKYLYYALASHFEWIQHRRTGTGVPHVPKDLGRILKLRVPQSLQAQKRIAAVLSCIDAAVETTEALIAKHQRIKSGLMHDLFARGVLPNGQLRPRLSEAPELYQQTTVGWIPSDWQLAGLQAKSRAGISWIRTGPFGSALKGEHWRTHGYPVITIGALGEGEFLTQELLFVDSKDAARLREFQLRAGDVVFSRVADVGRSVVIREQHAGWIMSSNLMRIALDPDLVRPDYLQMQLAGDSRIKAQIRAQVNSGGRDVANSAVLSRLRFAWPDPNEQDRIISRVLLTERALQAERRAAEKLQKQKLGLMQDLLTGRVSVEHLAPELASA